MKYGVVLGGSGTLGKSIIKGLLEKDYTLLATYRNNKPEPIKGVEWIELDIENDQSIDSLIKKIGNNKIDFFTSTVAMTLDMDKFDNLFHGHFEKTFKANFFNHVKILQEISHLLEREANVILILTSYLENVRDNMSPYITSKYALLGLMKVLASEWKGRGIRVNAVSPGMMDTKFTWEFVSKGKKMTMPRYLREKQIKEHKMVDEKKVAAKILEIIDEKKINGENTFVE